MLDELKLGPANVIYDAGGNFVLLTGWVDGADGTRATVQSVSNKVNKVLLAGAGEGQERFDGFHGDLAVALATVQISVRDPGRSWPGGRPIGMAAGRKTDQGRGAAAKNRPLR